MTMEKWFILNGFLTFVAAMMVAVRASVPGKNLICWHLVARYLAVIALIEVVMSGFAG